MGRKIDRTGEEKVNNFGSRMVIKEYGSYTDIDVYFPKYDWAFKHARYGDFKKGLIKCPYETRYFSKGYLGEGRYKCRENGKIPEPYYSRLREAMYNYEVEIDD